MSPSLSDEAAFISNVSADGTLAQQSFYAWNPGSIPADYSGGYTNAMKWGGITAGVAGGTVDYYFDPVSNWNSTEEKFLIAGLALWSDIANISFALTTDPTQAQITFTRGSNGSAETSPQAADTSPNHTGGQTGGTYLLQMTGATISIDTSIAGFGPINGSFSIYGGYPIEVLLHEEGHAIGLGHAGPYNSTVNPATQQFSPYDTRLWSIMSYINPQTTTAAYYSQYPVTGTSWGVNQSGYPNLPTTWMPLDILAAQTLYGLPTSTPLSGGQTFGFDCNVQGPTEMFFDFTQNTTPIVTLWDMGTNNTLNLSGFSASSAVNLNPGTFSSCDGLTNNICIAFNTAIDTFVGGLGNNTVTANNDGDTLIGGAGNDTLIGGAGNDTLIGGGGNNILNGGGGSNKAVYSGNYASYMITHDASGVVTVSGLGETDTLRDIQQLVFANQSVTIRTAVSSDFNGDGNADLVWQNIGGQPVVWLMNGATVLNEAAVGNNPGASWQVKGTGDFNGDGNADILYQNTSGQAAVWFMNGTSVVGTALVGSNPGPSWHVEGSGDFNADGDADILWQNDSGQVMVWLMNGSTITSSLAIANNPGPSWHVKATGDFDGDGKSDVLFQNDNGQAAIWLMNVTSGAVIGDPGAGWQVVGAGDFDGDDKADILWENASGQLEIWFMNGTTVSSTALAGTSPGVNWHVKGVVDLNGDGKSDIVWQNSGGQAMAWLMNGSTVTSSALIGGDPGPEWQVANYGTTTPATANDFNGDGMADILFQNDNGQVALWFQNGLTMTSGAVVNNNPGPSWHVEADGDFDGDGKADIVFQNDNGQVAIWLMNGATITSGAVLSDNPGTSWHIIGTGDFDGDGKADILWQNDSGQAAIWFMNGTTFTSGSVITPNPGPSWHLKAAADFNGDGMADMLWQNDSGQAAIWLMDGSTELAGPLVGANPGPTWHIKAAGDFNGDGKADILWESDSGQAVIWLMDGTNVVSEAAVGPAMGSSWQIVGASDLNGDGMADILWQNTTSGQAQGWLMNGTTVLSTATIGSPPGAAWHIINASS